MYRAGSYLIPLTGFHTSGGNLADGELPWVTQMAQEFLYTQNPCTLSSLTACSLLGELEVTMQEQGAHQVSAVVPKSAVKNKSVRRADVVFVWVACPSSHSLNHGPGISDERA